MINQNRALEEIISFANKIYLLESKARRNLITDRLFNSKSYFSEIEELLNEHKTNINNLFQFEVSILKQNKFEHLV